MTDTRINEDPFNLRDLAIAVWRFDDHPARSATRPRRFLLAVYLSFRP